MKTVTDSLFRHTQEQTDTASIATLSWREIFTDSQLQQLIDTGLKNNTDLNIESKGGRSFAYDFSAFLFTFDIVITARYIE